MRTDCPSGTLDDVVPEFDKWYARVRSDVDLPPKLVQKDSIYAVLERMAGMSDDRMARLKCSKVRFPRGGIGDPARRHFQRVRSPCGTFNRISIYEESATFVHNVRCGLLHARWCRFHSECDCERRGDTDLLRAGSVCFWVRILRECRVAEDGL